MLFLSLILVTKADRAVLFRQKQQVNTSQTTYPIQESMYRKFARLDRVDTNVEKENEPMLVKSIERTSHTAPRLLAFMSVLLIIMSKLRPMKPLSSKLLFHLQLESPIELFNENVYSQFFYFDNPY